MERGDRQHIALGAEAADHAVDRGGDEAVVAEVLALVDVGQVQFDGGKSAAFSASCSAIEVWV